MFYNGFISYSHAADGKLAPALQSGLHRFAKPWYRLRALHIFRDKTNLSVNPTLWSSIKAALDQSDWFILLASAEAAASIWVDREIEYWLERHPAARILMVLTEGTITWDVNAQAFDASNSSAVPRRMLRAFAEEPLYLDLEWSRDETDLSLSHPRFRDAVAEIASGAERSLQGGSDRRGCASISAHAASRVVRGRYAECTDCVGGSRRLVRRPAAEHRRYPAYAGG